MSLSGEGATPAWLQGKSGDPFFSNHIGDGRPPADSTEVYGEDGLVLGASGWPAETAKTIEAMFEAAALGTGITLEQLAAHRAQGSGAAQSQEG